MAAENNVPGRAGPRGVPRFNEAAAHGRGKRGRGGVRFEWEANASMRPRRMAAENARRQRRRGRRNGASMRPRRMAAENGGPKGRSETSRPRFNEAAAHGRGKPAKTCTTRRRVRCFNEAAAHGRGKRRPARDLEPGEPRHASMRPRRMAAENRVLQDVHGRGRLRFNEAAAHGRGKPALADLRARTECASMRPRRMAAENPRRERPAHGVGGGFNEAAAHGRGKRWKRSRARRCRGCFNEAAAHGRGKPRPGL